MNRAFWGLQILAVTVLAVSSVMLVRDWMQPSGDDVVFAVDVPVDAQGGKEYPLVMRIRNGTGSDIRIVGMNWC
jgi:membrane protein implicated in regulation of membrane protease activity